ncbi:MAG: hypothetical protein ABSA42_19200 [Terracidiphilus sp.]|jgi:hypothetical protein
MTYIVAYSPRRTGGRISEAVYPNAQEAWKAVLDLEASDETIRHIRAPWGGEIGKDELQMFAEEEGRAVNP